MRWDFFRHFLDIQGPTVASKDDRGEVPQEISGRHKDKDKSQPKLLSSKSLEDDQLIVSISPCSTSNGQHDSENSHEESPSTDKKSPSSQYPSVTAIIPSDPSIPSMVSSSSSPIKITTATNSDSPPIINYNGNVPLDDSINQNVPRKKVFFISNSPPSFSSAEKSRPTSWKNDEQNNDKIHHSLCSSPICLANHSPIANCKELQMVTVNINLHNGMGEICDSNSIQNGIEHNGNSEVSNGRSTPLISNGSTLTSYTYAVNNCTHFVPKSKENGIYSININETPYNVHNERSYPSPAHRNHCNSVSSSTDANNAEAEMMLKERLNKKGIALNGNFAVTEVNDYVATEDEASSIVSSLCSSSTTIGGDVDAIINVDCDIDNATDGKTLKRSETSDTTASTTTSISNSAEKHLPLEDKPSALFSSSPLVSSSYSTLRWTKAVANQEKLQLDQQHHSLPRYLHHRHHHQQFHTPSGTLRRGRDVQDANKKREANDFLGSAFPGYNNVQANTAISNIINTGTTCSRNVVTSSVMRHGMSSGSRLSAAALLQDHPPLTRPTSIIGGNNVPAPCTNNRLLVFQDKWRVLFDKFDHEGFGEITWTDFILALRSKEFQLAIEPGKLQLLEELARVQSKESSSITFQLFVNIMTGKRSRSFKCAVHHRDREVCSESDFHLLPLGYQSHTGVKRMARLIADEFLTDERDRKYYADHYRCLPPPLFIISITLIELGFFTYYTVWHGEISSSGPLPMDSPFVYRPDKRQEVWRFLFYMVLHAGWVHLMFNLLVQLLVGLPLEMVHGSLRIGCVYMAGVLAGSLGTSVFDPDVYLVGASGGVYALLAAHLANVLLNYNNMEFGLVRLLGVFLIASVDVGFAIYDRYAASPPLTEGSVPPVSYVAHLTGALAGLTIGLLVLKNFEQKLREQLMWWLALGVYAACTLFAILFNIFHPVYPEMIPSEFIEIPEKFPHHQMQQQ